MYFRSDRVLCCLVGASFSAAGHAGTGWATKGSCLAVHAAITPKPHIRLALAPHASHAPNECRCTGGTTSTGRADPSTSTACTRGELVVIDLLAGLCAARACLYVFQPHAYRVRLVHSALWLMFAALPACFLWLIAANRHMNGLILALCLQPAYLPSLLSLFPCPMSGTSTARPTDIRVFPALHLLPLAATSGTSTTRRTTTETTRRPRQCRCVSACLLRFLVKAAASAALLPRTPLFGCSVLRPLLFLAVQGSCPTQALPPACHY